MTTIRIIATTTDYSRNHHHSWNIIYCHTVDNMDYCHSTDYCHNDKYDYCNIHDDCTIATTIGVTATQAILHDRSHLRAS